MIVQKDMLCSLSMIRFNYRGDGFLP